LDFRFGSKAAMVAITAVFNIFFRWTSAAKEACMGGMIWQRQPPIWPPDRANRACLSGRRWIFRRSIHGDSYGYQTHN
jgi:hypothetical protein